MNERQSPDKEEFYGVIEAIDEVHTEYTDLRQLVDGLSAACDSEEEKATIVQDARGPIEQLRTRSSYALGSIAGRGYDPKTLNAALGEYIDENRTNPESGQKMNITHLNKLRAMVVGVALSEIIVPDASDDALLGLTARAMSAQNRGLGLSPRAPKLKIMKGTPDTNRPDRTWVGWVDPRAIECIGAGSRVVKEYQILTKQPHVSGEGEVVAWTKNGPSVHRFGIARKDEILSRIKQREHNGLSYSVFEQDYVHDISEDDRFLRVKTVHGVEFTHVTRGSDTYRIAGDQLQLYIPSNRASLDGLSGNDIAEAVEELMSQGLDAVVSATNGAQRPIADTFRPINTGRPGVPQVNPIPVSTGKRN